MTVRNQRNGDLVNPATWKAQKSQVQPSEGILQALWLLVLFMRIFQVMDLALTQNSHQVLHHRLVLRLCDGSYQHSGVHEIIPIVMLSRKWLEDILHREFEALKMRRGKLGAGDIEAMEVPARVIGHFLVQKVFGLNEPYPD